MQLTNPKPLNAIRLHLHTPRLDLWQMDFHFQDGQFACMGHTAPKQHAIAVARHYAKLSGNPPILVNGEPLPDTDKSAPDTDKSAPDTDQGAPDTGKGSWMNNPPCNETTKGY